MRAFLVVLAAASLALAGCGEPAPATAMSGVALATKHAQAIAPDAKLSQVVGIESPDGKTSGGGDTAKVQDALVPGADDELGDGKARAWLYRFESSQGSLLVVVAAGRITRDLELPAGSAKPVLGAWSVDSDAAAGTALTSRDVAANASKGIVMQLAVTAGGVAAWQVDAGGSFAYVDATTGKLMANIDAELPPIPLRREAGTTGGTVDVAREAPIDQFSMLQEGHGALTIAVVLSRPLANEFTAHVSGPDGIQQDIVASAADPTQETVAATADIEPAPAGLYTVTYTLDTGVVQNYQLQWCSDGDPVIEDANNRACFVRDGEL